MIRTTGSKEKISTAALSLVPLAKSNPHILREGDGCMHRVKERMNEWQQGS